MKKALRPGPERDAVTTFGHRRVVWVDACEIDCINGCLTIRAGSLREEPLLAVLPAHAAESLPDVVAAASLDAEEDYWDVMAGLVSGAADGEAADRAVSNWVLAQDWWSGLRGLVESDEDTFFVVQFGFVGMILGPPYTPVPAFAIFDPLQLRRLDGAFRQAVYDGMSSSRPIWSTAVLDRTLRVLAGRPWADLEGEDLTAEQARAEMSQRRVEFLARTPRLQAE